MSGLQDGRTLLQAKYDFNTAAGKEQTLSTIVQVGQDALVGCVDTDVGMEVSLARLSQTLRDDAQSSELEFTGPSVETKTLFAPLEDYAAGNLDGCSPSSSLKPVGVSLVEFVAEAS